MKKILVVSPHADDETLGAGGYLIKHRNCNDEIYWINVTNAKEEYGYSKEETILGISQTKEIAKRYKVKEFIDYGLEPAGLDMLRKSELVEMFSNSIRNIEPNIVIVPYSKDIHSDHGIVFDVVYSSCKSFRAPSVEKIMCMEIVSETDYVISDYGFVPNYYVDISDCIDEKIEILNVYKQEIKDAPFPRNEAAVRGLAQYRAAACYARYAEAFRIIKEIER